MAALTLLAVIGLCLGATSPYFEAFLSDNERPRLLQAMAVVDAGETAIDGPSSRGLRPGADVSRADFEGARLHPNKPPGATVPAALAYLGLRATAGGDPIRLATFAALARLFGSLAPTLILLFVFWRRYRSRISAPTLAAAASIYALATPVATYATVLYGHQLTACLLFCGVLALTGKVGERPSSGLSFAGGLCCASAVTVEYGAVFAGLPIGVFLLLRAREPGGVGRCVAALGGALIPIAALAAYHAHAFGSPWTTSYHHVLIQDFAAQHDRGLLGLHLPTAKSLREVWISPWGGLLVWAPVTMLAFGGAVVGATSSATGDVDARAELGLHLAIFGVWLVVVLGLTQTGGWRVGPRYLVASFPFLLLGLCAAVERMKARPWLTALMVALALGPTVLNGLAANLFPHLIPEGNPLRDQLWPITQAGREPWGILGLWPVVVLSVVTVFSTLAMNLAEGTELPRKAGLALLTGTLGAALYLALATLPRSSSRVEWIRSAITTIYDSAPGGSRPMKRLPLIPSGD